MTVTTSPQDISIRRANHHDAASIATLGATIFAKHFGHSCTPEQLQAYLEEAYSTTAIDGDLANPQKDTVVAVTADGQIVGFSMLTKGTTEPCVEERVTNFTELQRLYVASEFHGRGLGRKLAEAADEIARTQGFKHIWLGVWEDNLNSYQVYKRLGYEKVGTHIFDVGGSLQTDFIMLKSLY